MTTYSISAPDGKTYEIEGPAGATQEQVQQEVIRQNPHLNAGSPKPTESAAVAKPSAQSAVTPPDTRSAWDKASKGDIVAGLPLTRIAAGVASPIVGAFQVGANIGDWINTKIGQEPVLGKYIAEKVAEYEASKKRGMEALGNGGTDILGMAGSAATGGLALKGVMPAVTYAGKIAQGAGIGAVAGATTPSVKPGLAETGEQAAMGAAFGGGIPAVAPAVAAAGRGAYRMFVEPLTESGRTAIKGRVYAEAAGDRAPAIINALRDPTNTIVPGSMPTAGQAAVPAGSAEWAALQKSASQVAPSDYLARTDAQKAAQLAQVRTVGGTPADLTRAEGTRSANALNNYGVATTAGIDQDMAQAMAPQIENLMQRPIMQAARQDAAQWAANRSLATPDFGSVEGLDYLKKALDRQIASTAKRTDAVGQADLATLMQNKSDLLATVKEIAPAYDTARVAFAKDSVPVNQMQVGQYLENKLTPALGEDAKLRAAGFAGAVKDAPGTLRRSLDNAPRYQELTQVLTPKQVSAVNSVVDDLARNARFEDMATLGSRAGPNAVDAVSSSVTQAGGGGKIPNPLSRVVTVANAIISRVEGKMDKKLAMELAQEMLNPSTTANALAAAGLRQKSAEQTAKTVNKLRPIMTSTGSQILNND